jgi:hypothetical protein
MKTIWFFYFNTEGVVFKLNYKFRGTIKKSDLFSAFVGESDEVQYEFTIEPDFGDQGGRLEQRGKLNITISDNYEGGKLYIKNLAAFLAQQISFNYGHFSLQGGMLACKRIPETPEEEAFIGDAPYAVEMCFEEVLPQPEFDPAHFAEQSKKPINIGLVTQFNSAKAAKNPVDQFLGYSKIIEAVFMTRKSGLESALKSNPDFFALFCMVFYFESPATARLEFENFVAKMVNGRHNCAHLKPMNYFGYLPNDSRLGSDIIPLLPMLEQLAFHAVSRA